MTDPREVEARRMRAEGARMKDIRAALGVRGETVSRWIRDVACPIDHRRKPQGERRNSIVPGGVRRAGLRPLYQKLLRAGVKPDERRRALRKAYEERRP